MATLGIDSRRAHLRDIYHIQEFPLISKIFVSFFLSLWRQYGYIFLKNNFLIFGTVLEDKDRHDVINTTIRLLGIKLCR